VIQGTTDESSVDDNQFVTEKEALSVSQQSMPGARRLRVAVPLVGRDPEDEHRPATPLELFFDLVVVVAVAFAGDRLHDALVRGEVAGSVIRYVVVFFGIWWAWMNFTWFASAYDSDDVVYRLFVFVTMTGALILAAGVPRFFDELDRGIAVLGYVVMRLALVTQWIRAARADRPRRTTAYRYAIGVTVCQVGWVAAIALPGLWWPTFAVLATLELLVPLWAESASPTTWHPGHIAERYGLFMIIVLGEAVLAASIAIQSAATGDGLTGKLIPIIVGGLLILFSIWWIYFDRGEERLLSSTRTVFIWGYVHLLVFASVAAVGAGLAVAIDHAAGRSELGPTATGAAIAVPVAVYLLSLWALYVRASDLPMRRFGVPMVAVLLLAASFTGSPVLLVGLLLTVLVVVKEITRVRSDRQT
jgi:low temperature requirement protein LtrA